MNHALTAAKFAALSALTFALLVIGYTAMELPRVLATATDAAIEREAGALRELIGVQLSITRTELHAESREYRRLLASELRQARLTAASESQAWRAAAREQIGGLGNTLASELRNAAIMADARLGAVAGATERTLDAYRVIPAVVGARLDPWTDCRGNGACWQAQGTALLGAARVTAGRVSVTARAWEGIAPSFANSVDRTAANVERLTRPQSLLERVLRIAAPAAGGAIMGVLK